MLSLVSMLRPLQRNTICLTTPPQLLACDFEQGFEFHAQATSGEVGEILSNLFPDLYSYFDSIPGSHPPYMLPLVRSYTKLQLIPARSMMTGNDIQRLVAVPKRTKLSDMVLYLGKLSELSLCL